MHLPLVDWIPPHSGHRFSRFKALAAKCALFKRFNRIFFYFSALTFVSIFPARVSTRGEYQFLFVTQSGLVVSSRFWSYRAIFGRIEQFSVQKARMTRLEIQLDDGWNGIKTLATANNHFSTDPSTFSCILILFSTFLLFRTQSGIFLFAQNYAIQHISISIWSQVSIFACFIRNIRISIRYETCTHTLERNSTIYRFYWH